MKKKTVYTIHCMLAEGFTPPVPTRLEYCSMCRSEVHLSLSTEKDVLEKGGAINCVCMACLLKFIQEKGEENIELQVTGKHSLYDILNHITNRNN